LETTQDIFERIYSQKLWGGRKRFWQRFFSGYGSNNKNIVGPYLAAVKPLIEGKITVDLGCGDFAVGKQLFEFSKRYIACDIVRPLVEYNRRKFKALHLEFRIIDAVADNLPEGDVVLIRQVLQHLNNNSISKILDKLSRYSAAIITEHIPEGDFVPNIDISTGHGYRPAVGSGLVLTEKPFNLAAKSSRVVCEVPQFGGIIKTILYEF